MILPFKLFFPRFPKQLPVDPPNWIHIGDQVAQIFKRPDVIREPSIHSRRHPQGLVDAAEVEVKEVNRDLMRMVLNLLAESVGQRTQHALDQGHH